MATIALFCDGGFLAHVTRVLEVGRALARDFGHRVVFCAEGPYAHLLGDAGFDVHRVYTVDRVVTMRLAARAGLCSLSWWRDACDRSVRSDLELLGALRPDLVVGDMHWSLSTSARHLRIPYVALANGAWTRHYAAPIEPFAGHFITRWLGRRSFASLFPALKWLLTRYYALGYTNVRARYGLPPARTVYDLIEGDVTLLADVPAYMPIAASAPASFRYVGPLLWDAALPAPAWLARLDRRRPTLYFTMGSTGDAAFFQEAIRVFGGSEYQVLITTGGLADPALGGALPDNVFVERYAPGEALMRTSDVVISHGGNGTVYQALSCGVPLIGFPTIFEQEINMQRVCALGAGLRLWRREYDARALRRAVEQVLGDAGYRRRCAALADEIAHLDGRRRAALHIDHFLRGGDPLAAPVGASAGERRCSPSAVG
jgi:MGT family glycosyltransferase